MSDSNESIQTLYEAIGRMADRTIPDIIELHADNREVLAITLDVHRELMAKMKQADASLESALLRLPIAFGGEEIGGKTFTVHTTGATTRYDNAALISRVGATLAVDMLEPEVDEETGEMQRRNPSEAIQSAITMFAGMVGATTDGFKGWRKTAMGAIGINVDKYGETVGGRKTIRIS